jgi:demethylmacrocin O-methyltransferase
MASKTLEECAVAWTTDKGVIGHHYLQWYERYAERMRDTATRVLEIGVDLGKSHRMWRDYFPHATVIGLDSDRQYIRDVSLGERIILFEGNQNDPEEMSALGALGPFDLIVDDGSHIPQHQIFSFQQLFASVKPGGVYIIEDIGKDTEEAQGGMTWTYLLNLAMAIQGRGWVIAEYAWNEWYRLGEFEKLVEFVHIYPWCCVIGRSPRCT